jgi:hypothetical protein
LFYCHFDVPHLRCRTMPDVATYRNGVMFWV